MRAIPISKAVLIIIGFAVLTTYPDQWEVFTNKNDVRDIALSGTTLWAATTGGVVAWNLDDNSYKSYTTLDGLISCNINQVAIDKKGRPWVATKFPTGLFVYENYKWKQIKIGGADNEIEVNFIYGLEVDRFGNVWVYCNDNNWYIKNDREYFLLRYDGKTWHKHEGVYGPLSLDSQKNLLAVDSLFSTDNYLIDTVRFRIVSFNGSEFVGKWRSKFNVKMWRFALEHIAMDIKGNAWMSYVDDRYGDTYGVVCNDTIYNTLDGLADDNVRSITADESGAVWCATDGGISKFTGTGWETYDIVDGVASNLVYKILFSSNKTLYAATSKGISILKSNHWKTLKTINEPLNNDYTDMTVDKKGAVIFSGGDHIAIYNDLQWKINHFKNLQVGDFLSSKNGTLYAIGTEIMENRINKRCILKQVTGGSTFFKAFSYELEKHHRIKSPAVACSGNDSCFWLTDERGNLILLNKQTAEIFHPSLFNVGTSYGRVIARITFMLPDRNGESVWVGYSTMNHIDFAGIVHFDGDTVKNRISKNDGLTSDQMAAIARDSSGNLWFATFGGRQSGGIAVLSGTKLTEYLKDSDGKEFRSCYALFVDNSGTVWAHCFYGIARFDGNSWKLFGREEVSPLLPYKWRSHIIQDKSGTVWFGTEGSGLLAYKDNKWRQFTKRDGIPSNNIRGCAVDSKDNLWILTDYGIAMRKTGGMTQNQSQRDFINPGNKHKIKQRGSRFYVSSKDRHKMIRYTLYDLRGRVVLRQTIPNRKSFVIPENHLGSSLRILSIIIEDSNGSQYKYLLKMGDIE